MDLERERNHIRAKLSAGEKFNSLLDLDTRERRQASDLLFGYLDDKSRIVRTSALQALCELSLADPTLRRRVEPLVERLTKEAGAVGTRARKLARMLAP